MQFKRSQRMASGPGWAGAHPACQRLHLGLLAAFLQKLQPLSSLLRLSPCAPHGCQPCCQSGLLIAVVFVLTAALRHTSTFPRSTLCFVIINTNVAIVGFQSCCFCCYHNLFKILLVKPRPHQSVVAVLRDAARTLPRHDEYHSCFSESEGVDPSSTSPSYHPCIHPGTPLPKTFVDGQSH